MRNRQVISSTAAGLFVIVGAAACGGGAASVATLKTRASSTPKPGAIQIFSTVAQSGKAKVVVTGTIDDFGRSFPADRNGKANSNDNFEEVVLQHGTFLLDERALSNKKPTIHINHTNCSSSLTVQTVVPISKGTGDYAGISGHIQGHAIAAFDRPGGCHGSRQPSAAEYFATLTGAGTVSY